MANADGEWCGQCGARLKPLFQSFVCPNECDLPAERRKNKPDNFDLSWDDDKTPLTCPPCPGCRSKETEKFDLTRLVGGRVTHTKYHCKPCGKTL